MNRNYLICSLKLHRIAFNDIVFFFAPSCSPFSLQSMLVRILEPRTILCCVLAFQKSRILAQMLNYTPIKNSGFECTLRVNILAASSQFIGSRHSDTLSIMNLMNTIPSLHFCRNRGPMIH